MADKYLSAAGKRRRLYINTFKAFDELMANICRQKTSSDYFCHPNFSLFTFRFTLLHFSSPKIAQSEYHSRRNGRYGDIDNRTRRPTVFCGNGVEYNDVRRFGADEEHICLNADGYTDEGIDHKCNKAKDNEKLHDVEVILFGMTRAVRENDIKREEYQGIVPYYRVHGAEDLLVEYTRGFKNSRETAQQIEAHHKAISRALDPLV